MNVMSQRPEYNIAGGPKREVVGIEGFARPRRPRAAGSPRSSEIDAPVRTAPANMRFRSQVARPWHRRSARGRNLVDQGSVALRGRNGFWQFRRLHRGQPFQNIFAVH